MKKTITVLLFSILTLVGCGNNDENAMEGLQVGQGQISSDFTTNSSEEFPHTKPIQVQHAKYEFAVQDSVQLSRDEIAKLLPGDVTKHLPQNVQHLTPEDIARLIPKGTTQLTPEQISERLNTGTNGTRQEASPAPKQQTEQSAPTPAPSQQPKTEQAQEPAVEKEQTPAKPTQSGDISEIEQQVIELTNAERRNNGLADLQADTALSNVAREKSNDMQTNNYFSHTSPTYGSPFDMIRDFDVSYNSAGENIAQGQRSAEEVVQAWMDSEGHRANIMNGDFTHIGVGYIEEGHYWTQMFIGR